MSAIRLQLQAVSVGYAERRQPTKVVVPPFTESLEGGQLVCLIGPNGAGKSTLLRTMAGIQKPLSGQVLLNGNDVHRMSASDRAKHISVVLTQKTEVGLFTGYGLVAMGRHPYTAWTGQLSESDHAVVVRAIEMVGAEKLANQSINTMSDGERQKIMIARALAQEPNLLILDEPTAFLDLPRRVETLVLLRDLAREVGCSIVLSTHDLDLALRLADRIWLLPQDKPIQVGMPEELVLNGAFEAAFQSSTVAFDAETGAFKTHDDWSRRVYLQGDGITYIWTRRALERAGYAISDHAEDGQPSIRIEDTDAPLWHVTINQHATDCDSIEALMAALSA
ncbi:MAG: ABC transporter ATP-binding protein [Anaerolineaceae bacterium]|nr:ABC transporter ATP-binding protein [Anaerolineaceae bacterium]